MKQRLLLLLASTLLSLGAMELILRAVHEPPPYPEGSPPGFFWQRSAELGWTGKPGIEGIYSNGYFRGHVTHDALGQRQNSAAGTFDESGRNLFFLGDSTTAALEVDDDQTVPAILEQELRRRGMGVNVLNFGVRGYGTDQSVRKALLHADRYRPEQIVYLFTDNDIYDSNVLKLPGRPYGKGVYLRHGGTFSAHNYPVPDDPLELYGAVVLDPESRPVLYTGTAAAPADRAAEPPWHRRWSDRLERTFHAYRAVLELKRTVRPASEHKRRLRAWKRRRADPWEVMESGPETVEDVFYTLFHGCVDGGAARLAHQEYYDAQLAHLIAMLWQIPSLRRIHLVEFPSATTLGLMREGTPSTNRQLFESLLRQGLISSYVNLNLALEAQRLHLRQLTCRGDPHFCPAGNRWVADTILAQVSFAGEDGGDQM